MATCVFAVLLFEIKHIKPNSIQKKERQPETGFVRHVLHTLRRVYIQWVPHTVWHWHHTVVHHSKVPEVMRGTSLSRVGLRVVSSWFLRLCIFFFSRWILSEVLPPPKNRQVDYSVLPPEHFFFNTSDPRQQRTIVLFVD